MLTRLCMGAGAIFATGTLIVGFVSSHDRKVEQRAVAKVEKVTENAIELGKSAASKSRGELVEVPSIWPQAIWRNANPSRPGARRPVERVRGQRDPSTRDD